MPNISNRILNQFNTKFFNFPKKQYQYNFSKSDVVQIRFGVSNDELPSKEFQPVQNKTKTWRWGNTLTISVGIAGLLSAVGIGIALPYLMIPWGLIAGSAGLGLVLLGSLIRSKKTIPATSKADENSSKTKVDADLPKPIEPVKSSNPVVDANSDLKEIPLETALETTGPTSPPSPKPKRKIRWGRVAGGAITVVALGVWGLFLRNSDKKGNNAPNNSPIPDKTLINQAPSDKDSTAFHPDTTPQNPTVVDSQVDNKPLSREEKWNWLTKNGYKNEFGHLPYDDYGELDYFNLGNGGLLKNNIIKIPTKYCSDGKSIKLNEHTWQQLLKMIEDAKKETGFDILLVSGYRSHEYQINVFAKKRDPKIKNKYESDKKRSEVSAPPKHSEHSTGFVFDWCCKQIPGSEKLEDQYFTETKIYEWVIANAKKYGFEISFTPNNNQGISEEKWHLRQFKSDTPQFNTVLGITFNRAHDVDHL